MSVTCLQETSDLPGIRMVMIRIRNGTYYELLITIEYKTNKLIIWIVVKEPSKQ